MVPRLWPELQYECGAIKENNIHSNEATLTEQDILLLCVIIVILG